MCGIAGVISREPLRNGDMAAIRAANRAMAHRGPDGAGEFLAGGSPDNRAHLFMAMRRLGIIDVAGGQQPLRNEDRSLALIANGEVYNFVELRAGLEARGHQYRTGSDCESILHLYEDHGLEFVHRLRGMFAFALWDQSRRRLVLGRDRLGEKPLYLHRTADRIVFASELKVLLAAGGTGFELDAAAVHDYLHYGWIPEPATAVRGITKLRAGHLLIIDVDGWQVLEIPYWDLLKAAPVSGDPGELIRAELESIASIVVRSEVPIGIALSGGVDSSLIAAMAAKHSSRPVHAFSVGYPGRPVQDERNAARAWADKLGLPFHEVEISSGEMLDGFPRLNFLRDDPIADIAGFGYFALSERARAEGCKVLLQGQGGDELFWGYPWSVRAAHHSERKARGLPIRALPELLAQLPRRFSRPHLVRLAFLLGGLLAGWRQLAPGTRSPAGRLVLHDLTDTYQMAVHAVRSTYTDAFAQRVGDHDPGAFFDQRPGAERVDLQVLDRVCAGYLRENGLSQGDRLSMANSVELRLPLLDHRLAELVVGLQKSTPAVGLAPKQWLRDATCAWLPDEIFSRPKLGFNPPVSGWIASLRQRFGAELRQGFLVSNGVLDPAAARTLCQPASRLGPRNDLFIKYLCLEFWCRGMFDASTSATAANDDLPAVSGTSRQLATV
ncbi:MAG TPA: asparagine synthase (glutamine-hydrolyzing) [Steroidobacteraceae bacterium]|nr:asparagine synthase (glutamine-hydrolyzing) [Steroidobacteraceae bacterium]